MQSLLLLRPQTGDNKGRLGIIFGQRRNKAAIIAADKAKAEGRPYKLVPALIRDDLRGVDDEALALSVIENKHRTDPHHRDYIEAARQLSLMDLPPATKDRHARALGLTREELTAAEQAAQLDDTALRAAVAADFDLIELADFQEVQHISGARWTLERAKSRDLRENNGKRGHWAHAMNDLRQQKEEQAKRVALKADITAAGIHLIEHSWRDTPARPLTDLLTDLGKPTTPDGHARCPGHAAALHPREPEIIWLCADWKKYRHELTPASAASSASGMSEAEKGSPPPHHPLQQGMARSPHRPAELHRRHVRGARRRLSCCVGTDPERHHRHLHHVRPLRLSAPHGSGRRLPQDRRPQRGQGQPVGPGR